MEYRCSVDFSSTRYEVGRPFIALVEFPIRHPEANDTNFRCEW